MASNKCFVRRWQGMWRATLWRRPRPNGGDVLQRFCTIQFDMYTRPSNIIVYLFRDPGVKMTCGGAGRESGREFHPNSAPQQTAAASNSGFVPDHYTGTSLIRNSKRGRRLTSVVYGAGREFGGQLCVAARHRLPPTRTWPGALEGNVALCENRGIVCESALE